LEEVFKTRIHLLSETGASCSPVNQMLHPLSYWNNKGLILTFSLDNIPIPVYTMFKN